VQAYIVNEFEDIKVKYHPLSLRGLYEKRHMVIITILFEIIAIIVVTGVIRWVNDSNPLNNPDKAKRVTAIMKDYCHNQSSFSSPIKISYDVLLGNFNVDCAVFHSNINTWQVVGSYLVTIRLDGK